MFTITVDTSCDERKSVLKEMGIPYIPLTYIIDDKEYVTINLFTIYEDDHEFHTLHDLFHVSVPIRILEDFVDCLCVINDNIPYTEEFNKENVIH